MKYLNEPIIARCPICENDKNELLYRVNAVEAARHFSITSGLDEGRVPAIESKIKQLWHSDTAAVISCKRCSFTFAQPFVAGDYEFYNLLPQTSGEGPENWKWEFEKTYQKIAELAGDHSNLSLFEVGANTGDFAKRITRLIPKQNVYCTEYSQIGIASLKAAGLSAEPRDFREVSRDEGFTGKFDIICIFQVLEHLDDPDGAFKAFNNLSKPGSHLFIGVPNGKKIKFNELNNALLDMPPNHIGRYNPTVFAHLGKKHGWNLIDFAIEPFTDLDVMKTVLYYQSLKRAQFPPVKETLGYRIARYVEIKLIRLKAIFMHRQLGETLWVHYKRAAQ